MFHSHVFEESFCVIYFFCEFCYKHKFTWLKINVKDNEKIKFSEQTEHFSDVLKSRLLGRK